MSLSTHEARTELISKLIPELVKELSGSKDEKTLQSLESLAFNIIRNYRSISVNRYEVQRKLDDMKEKFTIDNFKEYADDLERLCNAVLNDPVCQEHYEVDIQWSLLEFMLSLAYNPTGALRHNKHRIVIETPEKTEENNFAQWEELKSILKEDFIIAQSFDQNSDLSDWSEAETENETTRTDVQLNAPQQNKNNSTIKAIVLSPSLPALQPPTKPIHYKLEEDEANLKDRMRDNIQNSWWLPVEESRTHTVLSKRKEGNFAILLSEFVKKNTSGFHNFQDPETVEEFCLLREILWVFLSPQNCKFFSFLSGKCKPQSRVTIPSISAPTLYKYLEHNIIPYVNQVHSMRKFLKDTYECLDQLPKTFEYYAASLKEHLDPILGNLIKLEDRIAKQNDLDINTLITLQSCLRDTFKQIQILYAVHDAAVLEYGKYAPHIISSFLLASLLNFSNMATDVNGSNLAISMFLSSIKAFCNIIDCWWTEGRLDDWQKEFLVECNSDQSISLRPYVENKEKSFFVPKYISKMIGENRFIRLLYEHSMEAGYTLNLLYEISRISDLRNEYSAIGDKLYDAFIDDVFQRIGDFKGKNSNNCPKTVEFDVPDTLPKKISLESSSENLTTQDEFLLLLFDGDRKAEQETFDSDSCDGNEKEKNPSCVRRNGSFQIFEELEQHAQILPLEELVLSAFERILRERITFANSFVVRLYRGNIDILRHLRNIRKVLLLEASDVMQQFYCKLFRQMETGQPWANAFVLTMQLNDRISSKHPEMSSLFRIEINSQTKLHTQKVTEAVEALTLSYTISNELSKIITEDDMNVYNEVFRFLLKVKWGLATLENLKFSKVRRRPAYAPLEMADILMRRLEQLRFWMFYGVQCVHSHLMMQVLQTMGTQLDEKIVESTNVREMERVHKSYLATISEHCFLKENLSRIKFGIEQMLNLVFVLRSEWRSCLKLIEQGTPLSIELSESTDDSQLGDYTLSTEIDTVELTFIRCHQYLANMLNNEVYINQNSFLSGLSAAFNTSVPC